MSDDVSEIGPMNLGNPTEFPMVELAEKVKQLTNSSSEFKYLPLPADDPQQRRPDIGKAKKVINWSPEHKLESGLINTIEYFRGILDEKAI